MDVRVLQKAGSRKPPPFLRGTFGLSSWAEPRLSPGGGQYSVSLNVLLPIAPVQLCQGYGVPCGPLDNPLLVYLFGPFRIVVP